MPYRRLPNTDNARIKALKTAIDKINSNYNRSIISLDIQRLELMLRHFRSAQALYKESLQIQALANRRFQKLIKNTRLYISHFIQVFNFCVIRCEIKKETKQLYGIDPADFTLPDLTNYDSILQWGENLIKGEQARLSQGGAPIYNPTIARVNVAYSQFKDAYFIQKTYQSTTVRQLENLSQQRKDIDTTLATLWNQVEAAFVDYPPQNRLEKCKEYGIIYYLRKGEKQKVESSVG